MFKRKKLKRYNYIPTEKCLTDDDNEVRERAFMYSKALKAVKEHKKEDNQLINFIFI